MIPVFAPTLFMPETASSSVALDAAGTEHFVAPAATSYNYTGITVGTGSHRALVVTLQFDSNSDPTGVSATWDSGGTNQAMTLIKSLDKNGDGSGGGCVNQLWGLVAPTSGNKTLAIATSSSRFFVSAISFTGVNQTGGTTSFPNATGAVAVETVNITTVAGDYAMCACSCGGTISTVLGTELFIDNSGSVIAAAADYASASGSSVTLGISSGSGFFQPVIGCAVAAG